MLRRTCEHAEFFAKRLSDEGFQILNDVVLNQVLVSFGSDAKTQAVTAKIQEEGICWCGTTVWKGRVAMRISVCSWATTRGRCQIKPRIHAGCSKEVLRRERWGTAARIRQLPSTDWGLHTDQEREKPIGAYGERDAKY